MIVRGDKIELVKEIRAFKKIGTQFEVDWIDKDGNITFNFHGCDSEVGLPGRATMTYKEFEKYFKLVEKREWSEWMLTNTSYFGFASKQLCRINVEYRTNGKKVQIRPQRVYSPSISRLKAEAACAPCDKFDLKEGLAIAKARLSKKLTDFSYKCFEERIKN